MLKRKSFLIFWFSERAPVIYCSQIKTKTNRKNSLNVSLSLSLNKSLLRSKIPSEHTCFDTLEVINILTILVYIQTRKIKTYNRNGYNINIWNLHCIYYTKRHTHYTLSSFIIYVLYAFSVEFYNNMHYANEPTSLTASLFDILGII